MASLAVCILFAFCWWWAPKRLAQIRLKNANLYVVNDADVADMIHRGRGLGGAARAEDLDPDLEINPIQAHVMLAATERVKQKQAKAKAAAARAAKAAKLAKMPKMLGQGSSVHSSGFLEHHEAGAFAKLGIHISFKKAKARKPDPHAAPSGAPKKDEVDLKAIDLRLEKQTRAALASSQVGEDIEETAEDAIIREIREAEAHLPKAKKKKNQGPTLPHDDPLADAVDHTQGPRLTPGGPDLEAAESFPQVVTADGKKRHLASLTPGGDITQMKTSIHKMRGSL